MLLDERIGGRWANTTDTFWALLAFSSLPSGADAFEPNAAEPPAVGTVVLDNVAIAEWQFKSPEDALELSLSFDEAPLADIPRGQPVDIELATDGIRDLHYSVLLSYSQPAELLSAKDQGMTVFSVIEGFTSRETAGKALTRGELYRQRVVLSTHKTRRHVALVIPIPSGTELVDVRYTFVASGVRDTSVVERIYPLEVRSYFDVISAGAVEVDIVLRAAYAGAYPTPPSYAECMYEPDVYGRTGGNLIIIRD